MHVVEVVGFLLNVFMLMETHFCYQNTSCGNSFFSHLDVTLGTTHVLVTEKIMNPFLCTLNRGLQCVLGLDEALKDFLIVSIGQYYQ